MVREQRAGLRKSFGPSPADDRLEDIRDPASRESNHKHREEPTRESVSVRWLGQTRGSTELDRSKLTARKAARRIPPGCPCGAGGYSTVLQGKDAPRFALRGSLAAHPQPHKPCVRFAGTRETARLQNGAMPPCNA
jgi:hypothetical protein